MEWNLQIISIILKICMFRNVYCLKKYYLEIYLEFMNIFIAVRSDCYMFVDNAYT